MLRDSEEHVCLVPDTASKAQRSWGSECGRGISLPISVYPGAAEEVMGAAQTYRVGGGRAFCCEDSFLCLFLAPVWAERDVGVGERQATRVGLTIHKHGLEGSGCPSPYMMTNIEKKLKNKTKPQNKTKKEITSFMCHSGKFD